jgi:hypothetical protein
MNLTVLGSYSYAGLMYQPQLEVHNPDPPLTIGETSSAEYATVYLDLRALVEVEQAHIRLTLVVSSLEEHTIYDSATVYLALSILGGECFSTYTANYLGEGEADVLWLSTLNETRWDGTDSLRWSLGEVVVEGINC